LNIVFADTAYWIALINPFDQYAQELAQYDELLSGGRLCTTEEVLAELLTLFAGDAWLRSRAVETVREILADDTVHVIPQSHESFRSGFNLHAARPDKGYSLVDCISMRTMRQEGMSDVLTGDRHFEQEGFRALFRYILRRLLKGSKASR
jgi:predicted nucleic acid-binding protein